MQWVEPLQGALPFVREISLKDTEDTPETVAEGVFDSPGLQTPTTPGTPASVKLHDLAGPAKPRGVSRLDQKRQVAIPRRAIAFLRTHPSFRGLGLVPTLAVAIYEGAPVLYEHFLCPILTDHPTRDLDLQVASVANQSGFAVRYVRRARAPATPSTAAEDDWGPESPTFAVEPSWQQSDTAVQVAASAASASSQEGGLAAQMPAKMVGLSGHVGDGPSRLAPATASSAPQEGNRSVPSAALTAATNSQEPDATARVAAAAPVDLAILLQSLPPHCELLEEDEPLEHERSEADEFVSHILVSNFGQPDGVLAGRQYMEMRVRMRG
jgi:hypothetical protein